MDLTKEENMFLFVCSDAVELVKLETSRTYYSDTSPNGECSLACTFGPNIRDTSICLGIVNKHSVWCFIKPN